TGSNEETKVCRQGGSRAEQAHLGPSAEETVGRALLAVPRAPPHRTQRRKAPRAVDRPDTSDGAAADIMATSETGPPEDRKRSTTAVVSAFRQLGFQYAVGGVAPPSARCSPAGAARPASGPAAPRGPRRRRRCRPRRHRSCPLPRPG